MTKEQAERIVKVLTDLKIRADVIPDFSGIYMHGGFGPAIVCADRVALGYAAAKARVPFRKLPSRTEGNIHY